MWRFVLEFNLPYFAPVACLSLACCTKLNQNPVYMKSDPDDLAGKARYSLHQRELYYYGQVLAMPSRLVDSSTIIAMAGLL